MKLDQANEATDTFREILWRNRDNPKPLKGVLASYAREHGFPVPFIKFLEDNFILNNVWLG